MAQLTRTELQRVIQETLRILRASHTPPSLEIADSNDGRAVNDGTDKRPLPFLFDIFAEEDERLVDDGRPPAKW